MDLHMEIRYAAAPDAVAAMLGDPAFLDAVAKGTGALASESSVTPRGDAFDSRLHRTMPPQVPDFVRRFVGDTLEVTETISWSGPAADGSRTGQLEVAIAKAPVQLRGTTRLAADGAGSLQTIDAQLKASVPFIGGKIEEAAAGAVRAGASQQEKVAARWLAR